MRSPAARRLCCPFEAEWIVVVPLSLRSYLVMQPVGDRTLPKKRSGPTGGRAVVLPPGKYQNGSPPPYFRCADNYLLLIKSAHGFGAFPECWPRPISP